MKRRTWEKLMEKEKIEQARAAESPLFKENAASLDGFTPIPLVVDAPSGRWDWYGENWCADSPSAWWEQASLDTKEKAFLAVVALMHKAELQHKGSYRWALYSVFGFDEGMYAAAQEAGYLDIHNALVRASEEE